jgi:hypothetical protein
LIALTANLALAGGQKRNGRAPVKNDAPAQTANARQQLADANEEIAALAQRLPSEEEEIQQEIGNIKSELRLRELRWRLFERGPAVKDDPFVYYPIRIELLGTYERLTDMLLGFAAFNYLVIIDGLEIKRARQQAPLVSIEANFTILLYSLNEKSRAQLLTAPAGDINAQLTAARNSLAILTPRFEERVGCWSAAHALGKRFPKSLETLLTEISLQGQQFKIIGLSRLASAAGQLASLLTESQLFTDINQEQNGPTFTLQATLAVDKAYQQWLDDTDSSDQEAVSRDPFTTTYSLEQLTQGSANADYPPLEKRIEDYLQQVNQAGAKRPDRISPYLVAELSLAGLYYTPAVQGAIFKTPNQKEIFVAVGAHCYNGRFTGIQQGRALFEESLTNADGKTQMSQVVKAIDASGCAVVTLPPDKTAPTPLDSETAARAKLPTFNLTLNVANIELHSLLPLFHDISEHQFAYVLDQSVTRLCLSYSKDRAPFGDQLLALLHSAKLTLLAEDGIFRVLARDQVEEADAPTLAVSLSTPPTAGRFGAPDFHAEPITLSITDVELEEVVKFFSAKYGVAFALSDTAKHAKVTASIYETEWPRAFAAVLRAARLGVFVEGDRAIIINRAELLQAQSDGRAKIEK